MAARRPPLTAEEKFAILISHQYGIPKVKLATRFDRTRRTINLVIRSMSAGFPELVKGIKMFTGIMDEWEHENSVDILPKVEDDEQHRADLVRIRGLSRTVQSLKEKVRKYQVKNAKLQDLVSRMRKNACESTEDPDTEAEKHVEPHSEEYPILSEMNGLVGVPKTQRRYSDQFYRFAYILSTLSPKAYRYARKMLILPSKENIWRHFRGAASEMKAQVTDIDSVHCLIQGYLEGQNPECKRITACISVDAFAFRLFLRQIASIHKIRALLSDQQLQGLGPFLEDSDLVRAVQEIEEEDESDPSEYSELDIQHPGELTPERIDALFDTCNHCFIYVLIPLESHMPTLTIHLAPASCGNAKHLNLELLDQLTEVCSNYNIDAVYMSSDGDTGWNCKFNEMFEIIASHIEEPLCTMALTVQKECQAESIHMATADLLHLLKRARGRYIDRDIAVTLADVSIRTNYQRVCDLIDGMALRDKSQLGRMRDFYPLQMFTVDNLLLLLANEYFSDALYFTPFTLLLVVIRVPFLRLDFRLELLTTAYLLFLQIYYDVSKNTDSRSSSNSTPGDTRARQRPRGDSDLVTFAELGTLERILCTIVSYAAAIQTHPTDLRTDALSTHIVEQKIGQARQGMDNRWSRILSTIVQSLLRSIMLGIDGITLHTPARLKTAGCCLDPSGDFYIEDFDAGLFSRVMFHSVHEAARAAEDFKTSLERIKSQIEKLAKVLREREGEVGKVYLPNPAANSGIMARLIKAQLPLNS